MIKLVPLFVLVRLKTQTVLNNVPNQMNLTHSHSSQMGFYRSFFQNNLDYLLAYYQIYNMILSIQSPPFWISLKMWFKEVWTHLESWMSKREIDICKRSRVVELSWIELCFNDKWSRMMEIWVCVLGVLGVLGVFGW